MLVSSDQDDEHRSAWEAAYAAQSHAEQSTSSIDDTASCTSSPLTRLTGDHLQDQSVPRRAPGSPARPRARAAHGARSQGEAPDVARERPVRPHQRKHRPALAVRTLSHTRGAVRLHALISYCCIVQIVQDTRELAAHRRRDRADRDLGPRYTRAAAREPLGVARQSARDARTHERRAAHSPAHDAAHRDEPHRAVHSHRAARDRDLRRHLPRLYQSARERLALLGLGRSRQ